MEVSCHDGAMYFAPVSRWVGTLEVLTEDILLKLRLRGWVCLGRHVGREFPGRGNNACKCTVVWEGMVGVKKCRPVTCKERGQELK